MVTRLVELASQLATSTSNAETPVDILVLGAGWSSTFLLPLLDRESISYAATSTTGHDDTIPFRFDPTSDDLKPFDVLPTAKTVLITFPLKGVGESKKLVELYTRSRESSKPSGESKSGASANTFYIQLGSTGIFTAPHWNTNASSYDTTNARAQAEDELLSLSSSSSSTAAITSAVLNLAGLYGGARDPKAWLPRVIKTKKDISGKKALHLVHGADVARAILAAHNHSNRVAGKRWIITDLHVYDWWELIYEWSGPGSGMEEMNLLLETPTNLPKHDQILGYAGGKKPEPDDELKEKATQKESVNMKKAVLQYMDEAEVRALPRGPEILGRVLDARDFWREVGWWPSVGRVT